MGGCAEFQGGHALFQPCVEVEGRLVAEDAVFVEAKHIAELLDVVDDAAVAGGDAFGHAGGAGGEDDVDGVRVDLACPDMGECGFVHRSGGDFVVVQHGSGEGKFLNQQRGHLVADHGAGLEGFQDQLHPVAGHLVVQRNVVAAAVDGTEECGQGLRVLAHEDHNRLLVQALMAQKAAHRAGLIVDLTEGQPLAFAGEGNFVRDTGDGVFQIFQNVRLHMASF